ncbi:COBRA-like protein 1 [Magnolia sinica]|uniref:COBRA-like protein 1 n=1 Tax=Magnolia sinica TaxID=86752 RepID=UPI002658ED2A|nr:COBRA-like protein 1 [Magnolia sinica]
MDLNANITIKWDVMEFHDDVYTALVTIYNNQLYRHVERPGWKLGWAWEKDQVIWNMWGAEATEQGNCSKFKGDIPHCCEKEPVIIDLLPDTPYNQQEKNCSKGGVLSSMTQDPTNSAASFRLVVGNAISNGGSLSMPTNFSLGVPGYTCGPPVSVRPTKFPEDKGRRWSQAISTWNITCAYSQFRAVMGPTCCVSLSSFYNSTIIPCPRCSCSCQGSMSTTKCVMPNESPSLLRMPQDENDAIAPVVTCTRHMCPIRVHWHVKLSYKEYWRVKVTVTNFNHVKNYSEWNLVVQHPNLKSVTQVFSFNYKPLHQYGPVNDTGMFWGIDHYNNMLLQSGELGNVQTEILLRKDPGLFTFNEGWAFPRKISFSGDECVMPPPDAYPSLPNASPSHFLSISSPSIGFSLLFLFLILVS